MINELNKTITLSSAYFTVGDINNDGVKECMLFVMDGHELIKEYK